MGYDLCTAAGVDEEESGMRKIVKYIWKYRLWRARMAAYRRWAQRAGKVAPEADLSYDGYCRFWTYWIRPKRKVITDEAAAIQRWAEYEQWQKHLPPVEIDEIMDTQKSCAMMLEAESRHEDEFLEKIRSIQFQSSGGIKRAEPGRSNMFGEEID